ncbi:putative metal-binding protein [Aurantibacillus circumpalustris]|uniref:putative metal-binding protein n=1 Tax=Aurantibacillus circumpalustris TaxID=3036359 RepID=UPI00295BC82D|nr:putative metal-binding protein [Aurantibacillus circumpalustris]
MEYKEREQVTDLDVTRSKFDSEIANYKAVESIYSAKGILCNRIAFPDVYFVFAIPKLTPSPIAFSIKINFANYDFEPPSVVFVHPFTQALVKRDQIPLLFLQIGPNNPFQPLDLVQGQGEMVPFLCIPGIHEYHNHPAHSGDSWFLHRTKGEGKLIFILDQLYNHSIKTVKDYQYIVQTTNMKVQQEFTFPAITLPNINLLK